MKMPANPMKSSVNNRVSKVVDIVVEIGRVNLFGGSQMSCTCSTSKALLCMGVLTHQMATVFCIEEVVFFLSSCLLSCFILIDFNRIY
jgi:hypothetical protein